MIPPGAVRAGRQWSSLILAGGIMVLGVLVAALGFWLGGL
jgi:hypothetical protein